MTADEGASMERPTRRPVPAHDGAKKVGLVDYDPAWPNQYQAEAGLIAGALGSDTLAVEHIGSTAIPGMTAKPTIDIMVGISALDERHLPTATARLAALAYQYDPAALADEPSRWVFRKGPTDKYEMRTHHLHVTALNGPYWHRILAFRNHLRVHPREAAAYAELKRDLARRFPLNRRAYTRAKHDFVTRIEAAASRPNC